MEEYEEGRKGRSLSSKKSLQGRKWWGEGEIEPIYRCVDCG